MTKSRIIAPCCIAFMCAVLPAEAAVIWGIPPQEIGSIVGQANINNAFQAALQNANLDLARYQKQDDITRGFANANTFAAAAGTIQGYQNYEIFSISAGIMAGVQAPKLDYDYYKDIDKKIKEDGDIYAGAGGGLAFVNLGIHAKFLADGLYFNLKYGGMSYKPIDEIKIDPRLIGFGVNYALVKEKNAPIGIVKWRGLSIGTGLLYNRSKLDLQVKLDKQQKDVAGGLAIVELDPSLKFNFVTTTYTVPVDIVTSVRLLWVFNFALGAGVDFNYGKSRLDMSADGTVSVKSLVAIATPGYVQVIQPRQSNEPSTVRFRAMAGVGLNLGPVKIDVPVIYYPPTGLAVGLTAGVVW